MRQANFKKIQPSGDSPEPPGPRCWPASAAWRSHSRPPAIGHGRAAILRSSSRLGDRAWASSFPGDWPGSEQCPGPSKVCGHAGEAEMVTGRGGGPAREPSSLSIGCRNCRSGRADGCRCVADPPDAPCGMAPRGTFATCRPCLPWKGAMARAGRPGHGWLRPGSRRWQPSAWPASLGGAPQLASPTSMLAGRPGGRVTLCRCWRSARRRRGRPA